MEPHFYRNDPAQPDSGKSVGTVCLEVQRAILDQTNALCDTLSETLPSVRALAAVQFGAALAGRYYGDGGLAVTPSGLADLAVELAEALLKRLERKS